jgi:hypothetical protein
MTIPDDDKPDALDAIYEALALDAEEHGTHTPKDREWATRMRARAMEKLAAHRRALVPDVARTKARPIRAELLAMTRDGLLARFQEISRRMGGALQVSHRHLKDLTDDDLRRVLETIESAPE